MAGSIVATATAHRRRGIVRIKAVLTTDASGDASVTVVGTVYGKLVAVGYAPGDLATGVDITVKDEQSAAAVLTLTNAGTSARYFRPTGVITTNAGVAVTADATAPNVNRDIFVGGKLTVTVAQGGNAKTGTLYLVIDEAA